ncbi:hypothetical protein Y1Q_0005670 [Alligator mississippiensis]|uniref:Uncharacterized protein n=1 Tax=Alligator mississippiensis TaxID=8496 RepID=A0A151MFG0_ALLMI|nr:hypothetical protein Y1Q_0005670 [Alligator mississippiensis]
MRSLPGRGSTSGAVRGKQKELGLEPSGCCQGSCSHGVWGMQRFSTWSRSGTQGHQPFPTQRTEVQIAEPSCGLLCYVQ